MHFYNVSTNLVMLYQIRCVQKERRAGEKGVSVVCPTTPVLSSVSIKHNTVCIYFKFPESGVGMWE